MKPVYMSPDEFLHGRILYLDRLFIWERANMGRRTGHYYKLFKFMLNLYYICSLSNNHAKLQINVLNFLNRMVNFSYRMVNIHIVC